VAFLTRAWNFDKGEHYDFYQTTTLPPLDTLMVLVVL
jgi:hypothetical protein